MAKIRNHVPKRLNTVIQVKKKKDHIYKAETITKFNCML